jgi:hypothetical protein
MVSALKALARVLALVLAVTSRSIQAACRIVPPFDRQAGGRAGRARQATALLALEGNP